MRERTSGVVLDPVSVALLEGGSALIVGTVADDGMPCATRGWGLTVLGGEPLRFRLLLDAHEATDGARRSALQRWLPLAHVACTAEVLEWFDQTPGPGAGSPLGERDR